MAEIDDAELAKLQNTQRLMGELLGSPKTKQTVQEALKVHHPEYVTDKDQLSPFVNEATEAAQKVLEKHLKAQRDADLDRKFNEKIESYKLSDANPNGYTDEGIEKIKGLMKERTIPDVDAAVALFEKLIPQQPDVPSGYKPQSWNFGNTPNDDEDRKLLFTDPDTWADKEAARVWAEQVK
jgi:hypothetical protein